jgi:hypothetical protein
LSVLRVSALDYESPVRAAGSEPVDGDALGPLVLRADVGVDLRVLLPAPGLGCLGLGPLLGVLALQLAKQRRVVQPVTGPTQSHLCGLVGHLAVQKLPLNPGAFRSVASVISTSHEAIG